jgi:hypothetical protein
MYLYPLRHVDQETSILLEDIQVKLAVGGITKEVLSPCGSSMGWEGGV